MNGYYARMRFSPLCGVIAAALLVLWPTATNAQTVLTGDAWYRPTLSRVDKVPPYRTQFDDSIYAVSDCGPAVLSMALAAYGVDRDLLDLRELTHTYQGTWPKVRVGTALEHMAHVADDIGLNSLPRDGW
jgi:hypothetical protein